MRVAIRECDGDYVTFASTYGNGCGYWQSPQIPRLGYWDIEIDIIETLRWGVNARSITTAVPSITLEEDTVIFEGEVIACDADGVIAVGLGDALILIEVADAPGIVDGSIRFETPRHTIALYPLELFYPPEF